MKFYRLPVLFLGLLLISTWSGCDSEADKIFKRAYDASYSSGYLETIQSGRDLGLKEGTEHGMAEARSAAESGGAWQLYWIPTLSLLLTGLAFGLAVQYAILLICRRTNRLPQFSAVMFVPGMKSTVAYRVFEKRRDVTIEIQEKIREMAERSNLKENEIREFTKTMELKIQALSSIDEFRQSRLVELAAEELEKIVSEATKKAESAGNGGAAGHETARLTHTCPFCNKLFRYKIKLADKTVICPNKKCGRKVKVPPIVSDDDDSA